MSDKSMHKQEINEEKCRKINDAYEEECRKINDAYDERFHAIKNGNDSYAEKCREITDSYEEKCREITDSYAEKCRKIEEECRKIEEEMRASIRYLSPVEVTHGWGHDNLPCYSYEFLDYEIVRVRGRTSLIILRKENDND